MKTKYSDTKRTEEGRCFTFDGKCELELTIEHLQAKKMNKNEFKPDCDIETVTQEFNDHCCCRNVVNGHKIGKQTFYNCNRCGSLHRIETDIETKHCCLEMLLDRAANEDIEGCYKIVQEWHSRTQ